MKIYIEAGSFYGNRTGVGRYGLSLTNELVKQRPNDQFVLFSFLRAGRQVNLDINLPPNASTKYIRWFPGRVFSLCMILGIPIPLEIFGLRKADLFIFPNFVAWPSLFKKRRISVIHDLVFYSMPQFVQSLNLRYLLKQVPKTIRRSDAIVAVSESTKNDLVKLKSIGDKITVVPNAVDHSVFNQSALKKSAVTIKKLKLPSQYILFVGTVEPRKNIEGLLEAYAQSFSTHKLPLVIVGGKGWNDVTINHKLSALKNLPIYKTDFVDDADLAALYASAQLFVYPSFYEGFGIPVLEAMASGCPVVCSNNSAFPEVAGSAAILVNANKTEEITAAINKALSNTVLRKQMIEKGLAQAQIFTWGSSATKLSNLIDEVVHG